MSGSDHAGNAGPYMTGRERRVGSFLTRRYGSIEGEAKQKK